MSQRQASIPAVMNCWFYLIGLVLLASGAFFTFTGSKLIALGGSWYFLCAGVLMLISGLLFLCAERLARGSMCWCLSAR